jgi:hypothetical protein
MGLRQPPGKQPSQLADPVPGEDQREDAAEALTQLGGQPQQAPPTDNSGLETIDMDVSRLSGLVDQMGVEEAEEPTDDVFALMDSIAEDKMADNILDEKLGRGVFEKRPSIPFADEFGARFAANLGRNPAEKQQLLQKTLGDQFDVRVKNGDLWFAKKGSKKFFPLDVDAMEGGLREVAMDAFADFSDMFVELGVGLPAGVAGGLGGSLAGPVGTVGGAVAAEAAASTAAREGALRLLGIDTSADLTDELLFNTGVNIVALGAGAALKQVGKKAIGGVRRVLDQSPKLKAREAAQVLEGFDTFVRDTGIEQYAKADKREAGEQVFEALDKIHNELGAKVGMVKDEALVRAGRSPQGVDEYAKSLADILEKRVGISRSQQATLGRRIPTSGPSFDRMAPRFQKMAKDRMKARANLLRQLKGRSIFGSNKSIAMIDDMLNDIGKINSNGGIELQEVLDKIKRWDELAEYNPKAQGSEFLGEMPRVARQLRGSLADDREHIFKGLLEDTPAGKHVEKAYKEFSDNRDNIKELKKIFEKKESGEKFIEVLVEKKNTTRLQKLKALLGPDSKEFHMVRGHHLDNVIKKATDPTTGLPSGKGLLKSLDSFGDNLNKELFSDRELEAFKLAARKLDTHLKIPDPSDAQAKKVAEDLTTLILVPNGQGPKSRLFWAFAGGRPEIERATKSTLMELAGKTKDPARKMNMLKTLDTIERLMDTTNLINTRKPKLDITDPDDILNDRRFADVVQEMIQTGAPKTQKPMGSPLDDLIGAEGLPSKHGGKPSFAVSESFQEIVRDETTER